MNEVVNCSAYRDGHKVADVAIDDVSEVLKVKGQFVWIGLYEPEEALLRKVQEEFCLHELAVEDALRAHQRPKIEDYGTDLFIVARTAHLGKEGIEFGETHFFVGAHYLVSVRHGDTLGYAGVRARCESMPSLLRKGPSFVLYALLDFIVDNYFPILDNIAEELETLEEVVFEGKFDRDTTKLIYASRRNLLGLKRAVGPMSDVCARLDRFDSVLIPKEVRPYLRDVYDHAMRINERIDNQREVLSSVLEANLSLLSVNQNEITKKLAGWAAILAAPTLLAGVWGMNFEMMPELRWTIGYPGAVAIMVGVCAFMYWRFRRSGWL